MRTLREHRRRQESERDVLGPDYEDHDLVFATPLGTPVDPGNLRRSWTRVVRDAGLPHLRFHDLRHLHATMLLLDGANPKVVSERLGHASVSITLDTYSHVLPSLQADAAAGLERMLQPPTTDISETLVSKRLAKAKRPEQLRPRPRPRLGSKNGRGDRI